MLQISQEQIGSSLKLEGNFYFVMIIQAGNKKASDKKTELSEC